MNTIVVNTLSGAVTEYDFAFKSITPTHVGDATGLYSLGGDLDAGNKILSRIQTGCLAFGSSLKKLLSKFFYSMTGQGKFTAHVSTDASGYSYPLVVGPQVRFSNCLGRPFSLSLTQPRSLERD